MKPHHLITSLIIVSVLSPNVMGQTRYEMARSIDGRTYSLNTTTVTNYWGLQFNVRTYTDLITPDGSDEPLSVSDFAIYKPGSVGEALIAIELEWLEEMISAITLIGDIGHGRYNIHTERAYEFKGTGYPGSIDLVGCYMENGVRKEIFISSGLRTDKLIKALEAVKEFRDTKLPKSSQ